MVTWIPFARFFHCTQAVLWHPVVRVSQHSMPVNGHLFAKVFLLLFLFLFLLLFILLFFLFFLFIFFFLLLFLHLYFFFLIIIHILLFAKASFFSLFFLFFIFLFFSPHNPCASWHWGGRGSPGAYPAPFGHMSSVATGAFQAWAFFKACRVSAGGGRTSLAWAWVAREGACLFANLYALLTYSQGILLFAKGARRQDAFLQRLYWKGAFSQRSYWFPFAKVLNALPFNKGKVKNTFLQRCTKGPIWLKNYRWKVKKKWTGRWI